jgi:hypothetical protein
MYRIDALHDIDDDWAFLVNAIGVTGPKHRVFPR